jgi:hypothetical protein
MRLQIRDTPADDSDAVRKMGKRFESVDPLESETVELTEQDREFFETITIQVAVQEWLEDRRIMRLERRRYCGSPGRISAIRKQCRKGMILWGDPQFGWMVTVVEILGS